MPLFGKRKKTEAAAEQQTVATEQPKKAKKRKKNEGMGQVLHESVLETIMEEFSGNESLVGTQYGEPVYLGLYLNTEDIGGLSKKSSRDEAKGSIIECINAGRIKTLITSDLMDKECMVLIPDAITLDAMSEYELLMTAPYKYCFVHTDGSVDVQEQTANLHDVTNVVLNDGSLWDLVDGEDSYGNDAILDDDLLPDDLPEDTFDEPPVIPEVESLDDGTEEDMPFDEDSYDDTETYDDYDDGMDRPEEYDEYGSEDYYDEGEEAAFEEIAGAEEEEVSDAVLEQTMKRRFYSEDLQLEVSTEPFDSQFLHGNVYSPFLENRGGGWLNDYLDHMSKGYNLELKKLHQDNLFKIRERYFNLIAMQCERITKELDLTDSSTQFGKMYEMIRQARNNAEAGLEQTIYVRKTELNDAWEAKLREVGESAARTAEQQYRDRYGRQHDEDVYQIAPSVKAEIENEYQDALRELNDARRKEAAKRLDFSINETLIEVSKMYEQLLAGEQARYEQMSNSMTQFLDDNRKEDIARIKTLDEELKQKTKADIVTAEYTEKVRNMTAEFEAKRVGFQADIERMERDNTQKIQDMTLAHNQAMDKMESEKQALQNRIDMLITQMGQMDEQKNKEYGERIANLRSESESWKEKCDYIISVQRRSNIITVTICIIAVIAALAIGFIGGEYVNITSRANVPVVVTEQVQE